MYKIIGGDHKEYGQVSAEDIRQWVAEGRANGQTLVQAAGSSDWRALSSFPEFAGLTAAIPPLAGAAPFPGAGLPAAPFQPAEVLARDYDLDIGACLSRAWKLITDHPGAVLGGMTIYLLVKFAFMGLGYIPFLGILTTLVQFVVDGPLMGGVYYFLLRNIRGQTVTASDIFGGFHFRFVQLLVTYVITALFGLAAAIPGAAIMLIGALPLFNDQQPDFTQIALIAFGFIIMIVPLMYLSVSFIFALPLVMDKGLDFWPAITTSFKVVHKHWWMVFVLLVLCGLIATFSVLLCCVPLFIGIPLSMCMVTYAYEDIFSSRPAAKT